MGTDKRYVDLVHQSLTYKLRGCAIEVRKNYDSRHKESIYQNAYQEELDGMKISYKKEASIRITY